MVGTAERKCPLSHPLRDRLSPSSGVDAEESSRGYEEIACGRREGEEGRAGVGRPRPSQHRFNKLNEWALRGRSPEMRDKAETQEGAARPVSPPPPSPHMGTDLYSPSV